MFKKIKKYVVYFARFLGGILLYILILYFVAAIVNNIPFVVRFFLMVVPIITVIIYGIILYRVWKKSRVKFYIGLSSLIIAFILTTLIISASIQEPRPGNSHDGRRGSDIRQMELAFELYFNENRKYPTVGVGCQNLDLLEDFTDFSDTHNIMQERFLSEGHPPYQFSVSADGEQFVVKATFYDNPLPFDKRRLETDLDGNILGCDCNDPNFCVGSTNFINIKN